MSCDSRAMAAHRAIDSLRSVRQFARALARRHLAMIGAASAAQPLRWRLRRRGCYNYRSAPQLNPRTILRRQAMKEANESATHEAAPSPQSHREPHRRTPAERALDAQRHPHQRSSSTAASRMPRPQQIGSPATHIPPYGHPRSPSCPRQTARGDPSTGRVDGPM